MGSRRCSPPDGCCDASILGWTCHCRTGTVNAAGVDGGITRYAVTLSANACDPPNVLCVPAGTYICDRIPAGLNFRDQFGSCLLANKNFNGGVGVTPIPFVLVQVFGLNGYNCHPSTDRPLGACGIPEGAYPMVYTYRGRVAIGGRCPNIEGGPFGAGGHLVFHELLGTKQVVVQSRASSDLPTCESLFPFHVVGEQSGHNCNYSAIINLA